MTMFSGLFFYLQSKNDPNRSNYLSAPLSPVTSNVLSSKINFQKHNNKSTTLPQTPPIVLPRCIHLSETKQNVAFL